ncbi:hypothetical protein GCM10010215_42490 [Streptomyces virginiae]|uniref:Uncharacterized protein n=1 Tax=Streptomyces virginiae TaxID=1961 RepID=A0ABQ3NTL9_STRVG|nr:hypothetical protein GCM10010215_42490 [Streptomyces virginiae]GHI16082.1 hypothetical protein Scinn_55450 [Streptomyces virginiae]GLV94905.1 hypothetical protein Slala04_63590 [Streptomyces lavendulae subsp. lavendulae]
MSLAFAPRVAMRIGGYGPILSGRGGPEGAGSAVPRPYRAVPVPYPSVELFRRTVTLRRRMHVDCQGAAR